MIDWHYPRPDLAANILGRYAAGMTPTTVLFAPRKSGKTEFVMLDVLPQAKELGYIDIVVDFWDDKNQPEQCLINALKAAFNKLPASLQAKAVELSGVNTEVKGGIKGISAGLSTRSSAPLFTTHQEAFKIFEGLYRGSNLGKESGKRGGKENGKGSRNESGKGKVLLFLDEVQHLGTRTEFDPVIASIRGFIDKNKDWLHCIMTGSSQEGLLRMFMRNDAPLYRAGNIEDFPMLNVEFVGYMLHCYEQATGKVLDNGEAIKTFRQLGKSPDRFRQLVERMVIGGLNGFEQGIAACPDLMENEEVRSQWEAMSDDDSTVAEMVALIIQQRLPKSPYSVEGQKYFEKRTGSDWSKGKIQNSLNRLKKLNWIVNFSKGVWAFESEEIYFFLKDNVLEPE